MREAAIQAGFRMGFAVLFGAVVVGNRAFYKLNQAVNKAYDIRHRVSPWTGVFPERSGMKQVIERVRLYKAVYGNGACWKQMKLAYWMYGAGFALVVTSAALKDKF